LNVVGKSIPATEEETAVLRHALGNAQGVLKRVDWDALKAALAQVTKYERNWNSRNGTVTEMARKIKKGQGTKRKR
jgi:hypothetical protein